MEDSVYVFMSHEELGLTPEKREYVDVDGSDNDVRVVSNGFVAPPPPADIPDDELSIDEEFASKNKIAEMVEDEYPTLLKDEDSPTIADINELQISINNVAEVVNEISPGSLVIPQVDDSSNEISDEVKAAYISYKNKDTKWMDFVRASGGMKLASQYRQVLSEELD